MANNVHVLTFSPGGRKAAHHKPSTPVTDLHQAIDTMLARGRANGSFSRGHSANSKGTVARVGAKLTDGLLPGQHRASDGRYR